MRLSKISISNFRCFSDISLDFDGNMTIIVGNNGSGKSALLSAISIGIGGFLAGLDGVTGSYIDKADVRHIPYKQRQGTVNEEPQYPVSIKCTGTVGKNNPTITWERSLNKPEGRTTTKEAQAITKYAKTLQNKVMKNDADSDLLPMLGFYSTGRLWTHRQAPRNRKKGAKTKRNTSRINGYNDSLAIETNDKQMFDWFKTMTENEIQELQVNSNAPRLQVFDVVLSAIKQCLTGTSNPEGIDIRYNLKQDTLELLIEDENHVKQQHPLQELSDGYRNTIGLIGDIAYRMAVLNPQLGDKALTDTHGVILIDEVDLHLHPRWQQSILKNLTTIFPCIQFVVTTHAPAVIMSAADAQIIVLNNGQASAPYYTTYGRDANSILNELMEVPERPQDIKDAFDDFYSTLSKQNIESARNKLDRIIALIGSEDPEIAGAENALFFESMDDKGE